jgi:membrane carboxypeptidase/penicillin-binding protein PbpC
MLLDVNTSFITREGKAYTPVNYDQGEHGPVSVRQALASSLNIPAVITLEHIGLEHLFQQVSLIGITTLQDPEHYDLSLALGGGEVRLLDLTAAYGTFASCGMRVEPRAILEISDSNGNKIFKSPNSPRVRVLDQRLAWLISDILSDNNARQLGFGAHSALSLERPAAVKTGTTSNFHDNWTVGYTSDLVVGVWTGNASYQPMRAVNGLSGAAPIWHSFLRTVLSGTSPQPFLQPPGLVQVEVCALSGLLPTPACPYRRSEWFIDGTQPTQSDNIYQLVKVDSATGLPAEASTPQERRKILTVLNLPPQAASWAHGQGLTLLGDLGINLQHQAGVNGSGGLVQSGGPILRVISPAQGSLYRLDPSFAARAQRILMEVSGDGSLQEASLYVDGDLLARFERPPYQAWWQLTLGMHTVWAQGRDTAGKHITSEPVDFEVK